ncbi:hypothetical protein B9T31_16975 [Acinetobacter sp. ANC 4558]|nr:hypothetical protein B9T31_16975 [Acinetobacter sp. ANC 4558]
MKDVKTAYDSKGGGYYSTVTFEDGVVLKLLHQAPSMMSKVKGGASEGTLKANQDLEKQAEDAARNQLQLTLAVATEKTRIETQLAEDIKDIRKAEFSTEEEEKLIAQYKERAANDIAIAEYALKTKLDDYADFQKSEAELLEKSFAQKKFAASRDLELTKGERSKAVDLLNQQLLQEQSYLALATEQRLFQIKQAYMHEVDIMQERYRLERLEIAKTKDPEQRSKLLNASYRAEDNDYETKRRNAHNEYRSMKAQQDGSGEFLQLDFAKEDAQKTIEESIKYNLITEEQAKRDLLQIEEDYQKAKLQLQLNYGERIAGSVTDSMATIFGEQSTAYKAMFAVQKGFAIAQSMLAIQQGIANAMSLPFPKNLGAAAIVAAETASILSNIKAVTMTVSGRKEGYFNGGFTGVGGKFDPAGIVHRGEVVWSQDDIKRWGGVSVVEAMRTSKPSGYSDGGFVSTKDTRRVGFGVADAVSRSGDESFALKVIINNAPEGTTAERGVDGNLYVTIPQVKQMIKESWGSLGRTGSFESKQVSQNFDTRKRLG